jgi:hypothetical protein
MRFEVRASATALALLIASGCTTMRQQEPILCSTDQRTITLLRRHSGEGEVVRDHALCERARSSLDGSPRKVALVRTSDGYWARGEGSHGSTKLDTSFRVVQTVMDLH